MMGSSAFPSRMEASEMSVLGVLLMYAMLLHSDLCSSFPLCMNDRAPFKVETPLKFCAFGGSVCCDPPEDLHLQKQFQEMNVSDPACASLLKSVLCAKCTPFSAHMFTTPRNRNVPVLCNSTDTKASYNSLSVDFCTKVWDICGKVSIRNSPFVPPKRDRAHVQFSPSRTKLKDIWQSREGFCNSFGGSSNNQMTCFNGGAPSFNNKIDPKPPAGLCLEKIGNGIYLLMAPHPDGSDRVFLATQQGKMWLADVPDEGSNGVLGVDEADPFLDITDRVLFDSQFGMMGMAFHPNFTQNGRFFLSFNCDKLQHQDCSGRCACNSDVNCDPSNIDADGGVQPCQYHMVIAEFTVNGSASKPSLAKIADAIEVRRIFTMGLPYKMGHAGQLLFGPADGYMYVAMGDSSHRDDPHSFAQNKKSLFGKILRFDVDNLPSATERSDLSQWGNYFIPHDNPYKDDKELAPEVWAMGFRNPWHCSFDSERPSYFFCGESGEDQYEEIDIIMKGQNYGWPFYEGPFLSKPEQSPEGNNSFNSTKFVRPVLGYNHSELKTGVKSASVSGGYFYRSKIDPCSYGRYLYTDLYVASAWMATEDPQNSGNFTTALVPFRCAHDSPINCSFVEGNPIPALGYVFVPAEDNKKDLHILTSTGVYRIARPNRCNLRCSLSNVTSYVPLKSGSLSLVFDNFLTGHVLLLSVINYIGFCLVNVL